MKIIINGVVYDPNETPIVIVWLTEEERIITGKHISNMEYTNDINDLPRIYALFPDEIESEDANKFIDKSLKLLD